MSNVRDKRARTQRLAAAKRHLLALHRKFKARGGHNHIGRGKPKRLGINATG